MSVTCISPSAVPAGDSKSAERKKGYCHNSEKYKSGSRASGDFMTCREYSSESSQTCSVASRTGCLLSYVPFQVVAR